MYRTASESADPLQSQKTNETLIDTAPAVPSTEPDQTPIGPKAAWPGQAQTAAGPSFALASIGTGSGSEAVVRKPPRITLNLRRSPTVVSEHKESAGPLTAVEQDLTATAVAAAENPAATDTHALPEPAQAEESMPKSSQSGDQPKRPSG